MCSSEEYKGLPVFEGMMDEWPQFYRKIELYLMSCELSYVLEKEINYLKIPANESIEEKK
ncbi:hypothetical protein HDU83_000254, partial [Entophlyctis luteolus]